MSTTRQITLTENPDGMWTAYDTTTELISKGATPDEALENLDETGIGSAADRVGDYGLFYGDKGEAFAAAVEQAREKFEQSYQDKQDDLFGQ